jgi:hypothetical protein
VNTVTVNNIANSSFLSRRDKAARSRIIDKVERIHSDIFCQDRLMLNDFDVKVALTRSNDAFCVIGGQQRKVKIVSAKLVVRKVKLTDSIALTPAKA